MSANYAAMTKDQLIAVIKKLEKRRYGLVWEDKREEVAEQCEQELPVLAEDKSKEIKATDSENPTHIIIEGDNYHALYALGFTHRKKIDVIYIDPPYNTGAKDFVYNDQFVDKSDKFRHSKWLSFMDKRLRLAKRLLKDSGAMFISIDDNEVAQLKLLCNDIFTENNFIAQLNWKGRGGRQDSKNYAVLHEYILVYGGRNFFGGLEKTEKSGYSKFDKEKNKYYKLQLLRKWGANSKRENRPNLFYPISGPNNEEIYPMLDDTSEGCWRWGSSTMKKEIAKGNVEFLFKDGKYIPYEKVYESETETKKYSTWIDDINYSSGTKVLKDIFIDTNFIYPKPLELMRRLLLMSNITNNAIILDFFAGSGTTGHAVLELNREDGGSRQFILCTNNENKICEEVTYPRIKKVIEGYAGKEGIPANVKYFKTDFVPAVKTNNDKRTLVDRSTELLCIAENTFEVVCRHKSRLDFALFKNTKTLTAIIYDEDAIDACCEKINAKRDNLKVVIYVFSYDQDYEPGDFTALDCKPVIKPIPEAILNVYRKNAKLRKK